MNRSDYADFNALRWRVYFILVISYMLVFFHRMAPAAVASDLMQSFHTTGAALGSLAAMYYYVYTAMQVPSGILADTLGPRVSVTIGSLVAGAGSILFGLADDFAMASVGRFLVGLGVSVVFVGLMRSNAVWFSDRHYGRVSGLTLLLGNLGSIMAAAPLAWALGVLSWREIFVGIGVMSLLMSVITWLAVRNQPQEAGFPRYAKWRACPRMQDRIRTGSARSRRYTAIWRHGRAFGSIWVSPATCSVLSACGVCRYCRTCTVCHAPTHRCTPLSAWSVSRSAAC